MKSPLRALVVDDDRSIREALERALALEGFAVSSLPDGPAALDAVRREPPDVMVLDVMMPELSGVDVIRRLRTDGQDLQARLHGGEVTVDTAGLGGARFAVRIPEGSG